MCVLFTNLLGANIVDWGQRAKNVKNTDVCTSGGRVAFRVGDGIKEKALFYKYL